MTKPVSTPTAFRLLALGACATAVLAVAGCGQPEAHFKLNEVQIMLSEQNIGERYTQESVYDLSDALTALLGTPDEPNIPGGLPEEVAGLLDIEKLRRAAGPVVTDESGLTESGLYRQHCAHCHGLTGDGAGPTAPFLNPYPRDYRLGEFKFKSTPTGVKPTQPDMHRILEEGIAGTAMPSFRLLPTDEKEALVQYVVYLTVRGEVERQLIDDIAFGEFTLNGEYLVNVTADKMAQWVVAENSVVPVPPPSEDFDWEHAVERGRELYYGTAANCYSCHGTTQLGDGQTGNFDNWTLAWAVGNANQLKPRENTYKRDADGNYVLDSEGQRIVAQFGLDAFEAAGALPPRTIIPRNFRLGVFRFGRRPVDIYRRITHGIEGSGMPGNDVITTDEKWYLVQFVRSLEYEALSEPEHYDLENLRERM